MAVNWPARHIVWAAAAFEGGLLLLAGGLGWVLGRPPLAQMAWTWRDAALGAAATAPLLAALVWAQRSQWPPLARLRQGVEDEVLPVFARCSVFELAAISLVAGVAEEGLFRGVLQAALADWTGPLPALAAASVLFGLAHLISPAYAVLAGAIGAYLGALFLISGNLLAPVLTHALYDFGALLYLVRGIRCSAALLLGCSVARLPGTSCYRRRQNVRAQHVASRGFARVQTSPATLSASRAGFIALSPDTVSPQWSSRPGVTLADNSRRFVAEVRQLTMARH